MTASFNDGSSSENFLATRVQNFFTGPLHQRRLTFLHPLLRPPPLVQPLLQRADKLFSVCAATNFRHLSGS